MSSQFYDVAATALECICDAMDAITTEGYPGCPCLQFVSAGEPQIECCFSEDPCDGPAGMLTVHTEDTFPSDVFPNPSDTFEPCKAASWVSILVVTASRCAPQMDEEGNLPSIEELQSAALVQAIDTYAILQGLGCCLIADPVPGKRKRRVKIQGVRPLTSEGGCASVEVRAAVEVAGICCDEAIS